MAYKLTFLPHMELSILGYSGPVSQADFDGVWAQVSESKDYDSYFDDLVILGPDADYSGVEYHVSMEQSRKFVEINQVLLHKKPKRTAFICATDMQVLMVHMFVAFVRANGRDQNQVECFRSSAPALAWIEDSKGPDRSLDRAEIRLVIAAINQAWCVDKEAAA